MSFLTIFLTAVGLAMDALAVSVSSGISACRIRTKQILKMALLFGLFQAFMPIAGYFLATSFHQYIENIDHWIAFVLLFIIGGKMFIEAVKELAASKKKTDDETSCDISKTQEEQEASDHALFSMRRLVILAVATSIDALAVGISFAVLRTDIWLSALTIGLVCLVFSFAGACLGRKIGSMFGKIAEIFGGLLLIGIGTKILVEHLFMTIT